MAAHMVVAALLPCHALWNFIASLWYWVKLVGSLYAVLMCSFADCSVINMLSRRGGGMPSHTRHRYAMEWTTLS